MRRTLLFLYIIFPAILFSNSSCNQDYLLNEVPKSFLSPNNAFMKNADFEAATAYLHDGIRQFLLFPGDDNVSPQVYGNGSDLTYYPFNLDTYRGNYNLVNSNDGPALVFWTQCYKIIKSANVIVIRAENPDVKWTLPADKSKFIAEARWARAYAYRILAQLYGGVPIVKEEINTPKTDFVRVSRDEVYKFVIEDLEFASQNLPETAPDYRAAKAAADHLLAEMYICVKDWDKSIAAATRVISNPKYKLMTQRFGKWTSLPGDVYWDLFRMGNQSNSINTETIYTSQFEYNVPGGSANKKERQFGPWYQSLKDKAGKSATVLESGLGRPVGFCRQNPYLETQIWKEDWNDMRNSKYNIQRYIVINNPTSKYYRDTIKSKSDLFALSDTAIYFFPYLKKVTHAEGHPGNPPVINTGNNWSDQYVMRLAETYLLRAEAYLDKGDKQKAADDINVVRTRAKAKPVTPDRVTLDYILDERARELVTEEMRTLTLQRLGVMVERVNKYNIKAGPTIKDYHGLWPIPQTEIDYSNGSLKQNPGY